MAAVLVCAGVFVSHQLRTDLDDRVDDELAIRARSAALATAAAPGPVRLDAFAVEGDSFAQAVGADGVLLATSGVPPRPVLNDQELALARRGELRVQRRVAGVDGVTRILARPATPAPGSALVVVGQSLQDRDEAVASVVRAFAVGGPVGVVLASVLGYLLAAAGLRPVEAMRRRARDIAAGDESATLPLPPAHDEVRRLAETLNDMLGRLRGALEHERRFVADASHELRTPVAVIKTELEAALRGGGHRPEVRESLVAAVEECDSLAQLAEDLLVIARAGEGRLPVRPEVLSVVAALQSVRDRFGDRAERAGRALVVRCDGGLRMYADPLRIRQALGNLVDNALRHGAGDITMAGRAGRGGVELAVSDAGPGVPDALVAHAFERFARADVARAGAGAGLGLAIVRAIAEAHGGTAAIVAGPGAEVILTLPPPPMIP